VYALDQNIGPSVFTALTLACVGLLSVSGCQAPPDSGVKTGSASVEGGTPAVDGAVEAGAAEPERASEGSCSAEVLELEYGALCGYDIGIPPIDLPAVDWDAPSYHPTDTRVITLTKSGLTDPEGGGTVAIQAWLADPPRQIPEPGQMVLAVAADVPVTTVAELQRGLASQGRREVRFLVRVADPEPVPQPRRPDLIDELKAKAPDDPGERVMFVAMGVRAYAEACPAFGSAFTEVSAVAPDQRCAKLAEVAARGIAECGCEKVDEISTLLYAVTVGFDVPKGRAAAVPVMLDPNRKFVPEPGMTWGELAAETFTDTQLHRLWIDAVAPPVPGPTQPSTTQPSPTQSI